jgi:hypothetical protein
MNRGGYFPEEKSHELLEKMMPNMADRKELREKRNSFACPSLPGDVRDTSACNPYRQMALPMMTMSAMMIELVHEQAVRPIECPAENSKPAMISLDVTRITEDIF